MTQNFLRVLGHIKTCMYKSRDDLYSDLSKKDSTIEKLKKEVGRLKTKLSTKEEQIVDLEARLEYVERKLKVYDAFFKDSGGPQPSVEDAGNMTREKQEKKLSDLGRTARLEQLASMGSESKI